MKIFGIAGFKNSGKTTLVVDLVHEFCGRGLRVATVKHAHHDFDIDHPGKDSYQHRKAGAAEVIVASAKRWAHIKELETAQEPSLAELISKLGSLDLVLVEGYKRGTHPKLVLCRDGVQKLDIAADPSVVAVVADKADPVEQVPVLMRNDIGAIAEFILANAADV